MAVKQDTTKREPHVVVVGGGPAGYTAALQLRKGGAAVTLVEEKDIGGVCVNSGCIPTRTCLNAVKASMQLGALTGDAGQSLDKQNLNQQHLDKEKLAAQAAGKRQRIAFGMTYMLEKSKVAICRSRAAISGEKEVSLADGSRLTCDRVLLATGSRPQLPQMPQTLENGGSGQVYTVESLLSLKNVPERITVVGAGILGTELAVILAAVGCQVRLTEKEKQILPGWDEDVARHMAAWLQSLGIEVRVGEAAAPQPGEAVVFCTGRTPELPDFGPGVDANSPWIYYAGDAAGGPMTADRAMAEGRQVAERILQDLGLTGTLRPESEPQDVAQSSKRSQLLPAARCVFTPLEAAMTGQLSGPGLRASWIEAAMQPSGVLFDTEYGFVKAVMDEKSHVLKGFHIVSSMASELITACQIAVAAELRAEDFLKLTLAHPIEGELLQEAVRGLL